MPSVPSPFIDSTGLVIPTFTQVLNGYIVAEQAIFGTDTNYDTNSPDGQRIAITAQAQTDTNEALQGLFNSFFADYAVGNALDLVAGRKGLIRKEGTFSTVQIAITTNLICTLAGLDDNISNVNGTGYTVQDNIGNQWILTSTVTLLADTTTLLLFRAKNYGASLASPNTITIPFTIITGIISFTNPSDQVLIGTNEENDTQLRTRYFQSYALTSRNQVDAVYANLLNLDGVTDAMTDQNNTGAPDIYGTPAFTLWTIVEGGNSDQIANVIYHNIHGSGMRGSVSVTIPSANGITSIIVKYDRPIYIPLYVKYNLKKTTTSSSFTFDIAGIKNYMVFNISYTLGDNADSGTLTALALNAINALGGGGVPLDLLISIDNATWVEYLDVGSLQNKFTLSSTNITITVI